MIKPYLMFNRNCEEAVNFYQKAFDGEILAMQKYGDMPLNPDFPVSENDKNLVLHSYLKLTEGGYIMASDSTMHSPGGNSDGLSLSVELDSVEMAQKVWDALKVDGKVLMDMAPSFFAKAHGSLKDKYGYTWMFTVE
ncbi:MAG: Glyoxalase/bleomycin resistance protein/dioxygenase [Bacillales bacterium]|jgi:PhnB protein|nr:Glyoxalase/bleomycin resistance protein/dioxygenase [Bacillales bacterium]